MTFGYITLFTDFGQSRRVSLYPQQTVDWHVSEFTLQSVALARFQGFIKSFLGNSTSWLALMQLQCSQVTYTLLEELVRKIKQNL